MAASDRGHFAFADYDSGEGHSMIDESPKHGKLSCRVCFPVGQAIVVRSGWQARNDPGHWGGSNPRILVLGFSKGKTQSDVYADGGFDEVAFSGMRERLALVLRKLGLLKAEEDINAKFRPDETDLAFASLVRCSLSRQGKTSGPLVVKAFEEEQARSFLRTCSQRFLGHLPERLRLVLMLGTSNKYIEHAQSLIRSLHPSVEEKNAVAYGDSEVLWVHVAHPSRANGRFGDWLSGEAARSISARKRELATEAIAGIRSALTE
jgi:hypothetical protein